MSEEQNKEEVLKKKTTSIQVDPELWKEFKAKCQKEANNIGSRLEWLIKKDLETAA